MFQWILAFFALNALADFFMQAASFSSAGICIDQKNNGTEVSKHEKANPRWEEVDGFLPVGLQHWMDQKKYDREQNYTLLGRTGGGSKMAVWKKRQPNQSIKPACKKQVSWMRRQCQPWAVHMHVRHKVIKIPRDTHPPFTWRTGSEHSLSLSSIRIELTCVLISSVNTIENTHSFQRLSWTIIHILHHISIFVSSDLLPINLETLTLQVGTQYQPCPNSDNIPTNSTTPTSKSKPHPFNRNN